MRKAIYRISFLVAVMAGQLVAQNVEFEKANFPDKNQFKEAMSYLDEGDEYYNSQIPSRHKFALTFFLKAQNINPNSALLNFKIGMCYLNGNFKFKCLSYFEKAYALNSTVSPDIFYYLGRGFHLNMNWEKAIENYEKHLQTLVGKRAEPLAIKDSNKKIKECRNGIELVKNPQRVFIDNLGDKVNTQYAEYVPVISADEDQLMFTSRRNTSTGGGIDENLDEYFEDIYISYKYNDAWTVPNNIGPPINTNGHDAIVNLSPDGMTLFTYRDDKGAGNIYISMLEGDLWTEPEKMSKAINSSSHESSASISYDGKTIFFISDREEGSFGDRDIWTCTKNDKGKWETAVNAGRTLNTEYGEEAVFLVPDGKTMFFSSQGHTSMGGFDIFKTTFENGSWTKPENLGYPINTPDDDMFFVIGASGKRGYYASVKVDGFGDRDLYMITFLGPEKIQKIDTEDNLLAGQTEPIREITIAPSVEIATNPVTLLRGIVTDDVTNQPLEAEITLVDNLKNIEIATFKSNSKSGKYLVSLPSGVNYGIAVKKEGFLFHSENFDIPAEADYQEVDKNIALKNITVGNKIVLKNIFFDFDRATLRPESTNELERLKKLLNDVPGMRIEISGHTDNKGSAAYNQTLSENRSKSVVEYLIANGIEASRLEFKGYGLSQPIAPNDTDEGRQLNRRTEFKILSK